MGLQDAQHALASGDIAQAEKILLRLVKKQKKDSRAWVGLGVVRSQQGNASAAIDCLQRALRLDPNNAAAHRHLGTTYLASGDAARAIQCLRRSLEIEPRQPGLAEILGLACFQAGKADEAITWLLRAVGEAPANAAAWGNLATAYMVQGRLYDAESAVERALRLQPDNPGFLQTRGSILAGECRHDEALAVYRGALSMAPTDARAVSNYLLTLNYTDLPQSEVCREHAQRVATLTGTITPYQWPHRLDNRDSRLRIGYVSSDLRSHSVAFFLSALLRCHDRERFEIHAYSNNPFDDEVTARLRSHCDHWHAITFRPDAEVAEMIRSDGIHILVDLNGHTAGNRLAVFAFKPAPIQVTWLGYPNTTGLPAMDYRLTDEVADPVGTEAGYVERLVRIPDCFLCYEPDEAAPPVGEPAMVRNGHITFGSFNNYAKISDQTIEMWADVLRQVPDAILMIKNPSLTDDRLREACQQRFERAGVTAGRLRLRGHTETRQEHLALYGEVDIALDTYPYNGTTTTCEALWMGVPVVSLRGATHASRVGASLLRAAGLDQLVAGDVPTYVQTAVGLTNDRERLAGLRAGMRDQLRASILCDAQGFARRIERLFLERAAKAS